jgi:hypothetical protein
MRTIIINSSNLVSGSTNTYQYNFPTSVQFKDGAEVGVSQISMYNSSFNVSSSRSNNTITLIWNAATPTTYTFTLPDGYYSVTDLNSFLQQQCILNKLYVTSSTGNYVYFAEFQTNAVRYAVSTNLYPIPTAAQATTLGYTIPSGATWTFPAAAACPQFTITTGFGALIGLSAGNYPSSATSTTAVQQISNITPNINPVNSYVLTCNLVNSNVSIPPTILFSIPINAGIGEQLNFNPSQIVFNRIAPNVYSFIRIQVLDQLLNPTPLNDTNLVLILAIDDGAMNPRV